MMSLSRKSKIWQCQAAVPIDRANHYGLVDARRNDAVAPDGESHHPPPIPSRLMNPVDDHLKRECSGGSCSA